MSEEKPGQLIVELSWDEGGMPRTAAFGPWEVAEDDSHVAAIWEFMDDWKRVTGLLPQRAVMEVVFGPAEWLRDQKRRRM